jgi:cysteine-rich repeat protein
MMSIPGFGQRGALACSTAMGVALRCAAVLVGVLAFGLGMASAADQLVVGRVILIKNPVPGRPENRRVKVYATEYSGATLVGDPTVGGATLRVIANGGTPSDETFNLPAPQWTRRTSRSGTVYYKYRDYGLNGPVEFVIIRYSSGGRFYIKGRASAEFDPLNVVPPDPGTDAAIVLAIGGGDTYCSGFGGNAGGTLINKPSGNPFKVFGVKRPTAEIVGCPAPEGLCGDGMLDPGEECDDGNFTTRDGCEPDCTASPNTPCIITGCSSQVCADRPVMTTCEFRCEYACVRLTTCEVQANGTCGWTKNAAFEACIAQCAE